MEESSLYTDENIDEVLGVDDEDDYCERRDDDHHVPDSAHDLELSRKQVFELKNDSGYSDFTKNHVEDSDAKFEQNLIDPVTLERRQQEAVTRFDELIGFNAEEKFHDLEPITQIENAQTDEIVENAKQQPLIDVAVSKEEPVVNYENIMIANQVLGLSQSSVDGFPMSPMSCVEPPKEKPPPPPLDMSDEETEAPELPPKSSLRRLDSTKRIKKEIRKKRSDFLGIEGTNDDAYLDPGKF